MNNSIDHRAENLTRPVIQVDAGITQPIRTVSLAIRVGVLVYVALMVGAEIVTIFVGVIPAAVIYAILLVGLTNLAYFSRSPVARRIFLPFTLLPLLRILSLAMPMLSVAPIFWYVLVGIPLLLATLWITHVNGLPTLKLDLHWLGWISQYLFGLCGISLGLIASIILKASPFVSYSSPGGIILGGIILTLFSAVTEEIIFRGLVQKALSYPFGNLSVFFSSILYASMLLGTLSPAYVLFFGLTGLFFALWVHMSDSLWGVIMAHSLLNIMFLLLFSLHWPYFT